MIVVDASALVVALVGRPGPQTKAVTDALATAQAVHAPELVVLESLHALRGLLRGRHVDRDDADAAVSALGTLRLQLHGHAALADEVWVLRDRLSAYDASYLVVAERTRARVLMTADKGLAAVATEQLGPARVSLV